MVATVRQLKLEPVGRKLILSVGDEPACAALTEGTANADVAPALL